MTNNIKSAIEKNASGNMLGILVWWGTFLASITPEKLRLLADKHGLDEKLLPDPPTPERAFRRAAAHATSDGKGWRVEHIFSDSSEITYGILERFTDKPGRRAEYRQVAKATWFPPLQKFMSDCPSHSAVKDIAKNLPYYSEHYITDDISVLSNNVMREAKAIRMVGTGGNSRFVPSENAHLVEALVNVLAEVTGCQMETIVVPDDEMSRGTMVRAAQSNFAAKVEAAEAEVEKLRLAIDTAQQDGGRGPREGTLRNRIMEIREIQEKLDLFTDVLRFKAEDLEGRLRESERALEDLLGF